MPDFNTPIDISKLSNMSLDIPDDILSDDTPLDIPTSEKSKRGKPKKEKPKVTLPYKEQVPTYTPKPAAKIKRQASAGSIKPGEVRGVEALSPEDKKYIEENARRMPYTDIAAELGKTRITVYKYMEKHGLLSEEDKRDSRIRRAILNDLHNQTFWSFVKKQNSPEELEFFEETWYAFIVQLDDNVTPTEQMQLRRLIETQISIDRLAIQERKAIADLERHEEDIQELKSAINETDDDDEMLFLREELRRIENAQSALLLSRTNSGKDMDNLVKAQSKLMNDLDVTRTNRVEKYEVSDKTWAKMLLLQKEEPRLKKQMGAMAYISFLATEKMRGKLTIDYEYSDGTIAPPMLLPEGCVSQELMQMCDALYTPKVEDD